MKYLIYIIASLLGGALTIHLLYRHNKNSFLKGRVPADAVTMHKEVADRIDFHTFNSLVNVMGQAYAIDPGLIRPDDLLSKFLAIDSWLLGAGTEKLDQWLHEHGVREVPAKDMTVLELACLIQAISQK